ncbi:MAG: acetate--CoA ligase family protein [Syntrophales bacterium]|nr:acetate--CoA ligase family protein [Syntrophales bacterium]
MKVVESKQVLSEGEAKRLLRQYGVPVVDEYEAVDEKEAVKYSRQLGFPVVIKGMGKKLLHKTELGVVFLNISDEEGVKRACNEIRRRAGDDVEAFLIQPMIKGKREFVAGLIRDPQFGPSVMFGLGGIFTEALNDVVFRIAPVSEEEAHRMLEEIRSKVLLGAFRGERAADRELMVKVITGLSRLGLERADILEVDINPLVVDETGKVFAVDALIVLKEAAPVEISISPEPNREEVMRALDRMVHARSVAVVGASRPPAGGFPGMYMCMRRFGFPGRLYPVNPNIEEIEGVKTYPNLSALPEQVDLVIVSVPAHVVPSVLEECVVTGNRNIHIFTSGFKETGEEERVNLQNKLEEIARRGRLHVIGPNCMGLYVPSSRMVTWVGASPISGPVAFVSQSGGNAEDFTHYLSDRYGIHISKSFSYGNALTLDSTDFLHYLERDDETRIIAMYLEGVKDGRSFFEVVSRLNLVKPIIIFKGGLTESGARAVSSHTGSLAGGEKIWQAFFRQTGVIPVCSLEEMADVVLAAHHLKWVGGSRVAVLGIGGGIGVFVSDICARAGLSLPPLSPGLVKKLREFIPPAGTMIKNPIDAVPIFVNLPALGDVLEILARSGEVDNFIISLPLDWLHGRSQSESYVEKVARYLVTVGKERLMNHPLIVVRRQYRPDTLIRSIIPRLDEIVLNAGVPIYDSLERAVYALARFYEHCRFVASKKGSQPN